MIRTINARYQSSSRSYKTHDENIKKRHVDRRVAIEKPVEAQQDAIEQEEKDRAIFGNVMAQSPLLRAARPIVKNGKKKPP
jgi:hypothetical protein